MNAVVRAATAAAAAVAEAAAAADPNPYAGSINSVGVPPALLASTQFNAHPVPLRIAGVHETNPALFRMLADAATPAEAIEAFDIYMRTVFGIDGQGWRDANGRRRFRSSYLRLLQGWGRDANGVEGAVLKGWVESRFGLRPNFHGEKLGRYPSPAQMAYLEQKMSGLFHGNSIQLQLELLYEYVQWMLRRQAPACAHLTLFRGVDGIDAHDVVARHGRRELTLRLNNLLSFSGDREIASTFGAAILEAQVPVVKILAHGALLPGHVLASEGEYLVIGGDYRVTFAYL